MADTAIDEAGVRFVVEGLSEYLSSIDKANGKTTDIGTKTEQASQRSGKAWAAIGASAVAAGQLIATAAEAAGRAIAQFAIDAAVDLDAAADAIQVTTGETGESLAVLQQSFNNVFQNVPSDAADVADAIGALNQKLDLTGEPLEAIATQVLNLSRITGTDLTANIDAVTGAFQRWQTPAEEMPGLLDELFRASQESGVPVADMATSLQDNKAVIDGLNLTMPEAIELIGSIGKSGIDAGTAFGGLRIAMTKMAREGVEDPAAALQEYFDRIKNAATDTEATRLAVEAFGRSGVTMAGAIRDGTFDLKDFKAQLDLNKNTIDGTAASTDDWKEKLEILRNRIIVAISPALNEMFSGLTKLVEDLQPQLDKFAAWWTDTGSPAVKQFWTDVQPLLAALWAAFQTGWSIVQPILQGTADLIAGVAKGLAEAVIVISAIIDGDWSKAWEHAQELVQNVMDGIIGYIVGLATAFFNAGKLIFEKVSDGLMSVPILSDIISLGVDIVAAVVNWGAGMFNIGYSILNKLWDGLKAVWENIWDWFSNLSLPDFPIPDLPFGVDLPIDITPIPQFLDNNDDWLMKWWEEQLKKQEQADKRAEMRRIWEEWWKQHPPDIGPIEIPVDLKFVPQNQVPIDQDHPRDDTPPWVDIPIPDEMTPRDRRRPGRLKPGEPGLTDISDPASFLELVLRAIATIEALADANIAPVSRKKLLALAGGLRAIIVEFGNAMKGIKPEVAEAAAIIATFLDPILDALDKGIDVIDKIASGGGVGQDRIRAVLGAIRAITVEAGKALNGLDPSKLKTTDETAELVASIMASLAAAARDAWDLANTGKPGDGTGGDPGTGTQPGTGSDWPAILAGIRGTLPGVGAHLSGAPGGISYNVVANYSNPQTPQSIRLDLEELALLAVA